MPARGRSDLAAVLIQDVAVLAWQWLQHLGRRNPKPRVDGVWSSSLLPSHQVVCRRTPGSELHYYILSSCMYGALAWSVSCRASLFADYMFFSLISEGTPLSAVFVEVPSQWHVVPTKVISPARAKTLCGSAASLGVCLVADGPELGMLQWAFRPDSPGISLTVRNLEDLISSMGLEVRSGNKASKYAQLLRAIFPDRSEADVAAMVERAMKPVPTQKDRVQDMVQKHPELALGVEAMLQLDGSARADFQDVANVVREQIMGEAPEDYDERDEGSGM